MIIGSQFYGGGERRFVAGCSQAEEKGERKKEEGGREGERKRRRNGRGRSPLQYTLEQDKIGTHRRKRRKKGGKGTGRKWGKSCCILQYPPRRLCKRKKEKN